MRSGWDSVTSRPVTTPPAPPTAVVRRPTAAASAGTSRRTVIEYEAVGMATDTVYPCSLPPLRPAANEVRSFAAVRPGDRVTTIGLRAQLMPGCIDVPLVDSLGGSVAGDSQ